MAIYIHGPRGAHIQTIYNYSLPSWPYSRFRFRPRPSSSSTRLLSLPIRRDVYPNKSFLLTELAIYLIRLQSGLLLCGAKFSWLSSLFRFFYVLGWLWLTRSTPPTIDLSSLSQFSSSHSLVRFSFLSWFDYPLVKSLLDFAPHVRQFQVL